MRKNVACVLLALLMLLGGLLPALAEDDACYWKQWRLEEVQTQMSKNVMWWYQRMDEDISDGTRGIRCVATSENQVAVLFTQSASAQDSGERIDKCALLNVYDAHGRFLYGYAMWFQVALYKSQICFYGDDVLIRLVDTHGGRIYRFSNQPPFRIYRMTSDSREQTDSAEKIQIVQQTGAYLSIAAPDGQNVVVIDHRAESQQLRQLTTQTRIAFAIVGSGVMVGIAFVLAQKAWDEWNRRQNLKTMKKRSLQ